MTCRSGCSSQRLGEDVADVVAPEVLVLDVDEPPGPLHGLGVAAGDAALAAAGERVVAAEPQVRVGAQQLDDVGAAVDRRRGRRLLGQRVRVEVQPARAGPGRSAAGCGSAAWGPATARGTRSRRRGRPGPLIAAWMSCHGGVSPYSFASCLRLRVAVVVGVVAARVAQVDAADVRDVAGRVVAVPDHHQLLVVRAAQPHPHVEQRLGARAAGGCGRAAGSRSEVKPSALRVGAPDQAADVDARARRRRPSTSATSLPGSPVSRSSASPCQSVKSTRSPARVASSRS